MCEANRTSTGIVRFLVHFLKDFGVDLVVLYFCYYCSRVGRLDFAALGRWELGFVCRIAAGYQAYMVGRCFWSFFF